MSEKTTKEGKQTESVDSQSQSQVGGMGENKSIDDKESTSAHQLQTPIAFNVIAAPKVCPPGYRMDATGKCRKIM